MISRNSGRAGVICLALALPACSSDGSNERAVQALREIATSSFQSPAAIRVPINKPYIVVSYGEARTPMTLNSDREGIEQFTGPGGVEMTLHNGILARLRGLGQEYEAFYPASESPYLGNLFELAKANTTVSRIGTYWINQKPQRDRFRCTFSFQRVESGFRKFGENCKSLYSRLSFSNTYWTDRNGTLVVSRQWFHPKALSLQIEHRRLKSRRGRQSVRE